MKAAGAAILIALGVAACATKVASTVPGTFTAVDPTLIVADLNALDAAQLCVDSRVFADNSGLSTTWSAGFCAGDLPFLQQERPDVCRDAVAGCLKTYPAYPLNYGDCQAFYENATHCKLTVGKYASCVLARANRVADFVAMGVAACNPTVQLPKLDPACENPLVDSIAALGGF